jgi:hypothetical protein
MDLSDPFPCACQDLRSRSRLGHPLPDLTAAWWPAALISLTIACTAAIRTRASVDVLADLIETAADVHAKDLAAALDLPLPASPTPQS